MPELHDLTALEQAEAVRTGTTSPVELVEHCIGRIEALDGEVGAFVTRTFDTARQQAREAEAAVRRGEDLPALHGVPLAVKDLDAVAGVPSRLGSAVTEGFVPTWSDTVVVRMREAGTISLGKTATPEFGLPCYTETDLGTTRNPWDLRLSPGGSSGGAAAAVAAGMLPFAQGSDGGGSVRIPASVCGLFGIKVSRGRISRGPVLGDLTGLSWHGPLTRTVADAAALLDAMAGPAVGDPHWAPPPAQTFLSAALEQPGRLTVGRTRTPIVEGADVHPHVVEAYDAASALLEELGHEVVDVPPPFGPELLPHFRVLWSVSAATAPVDPSQEHRLRPLTRWLRELGRSWSAVDFAAATSALQGAARRGIAATAGFDVLLTPTLAQPPVPVGWFTDGVGPEEEFDRMTRWTPFTAILNMTGQPAVNVPLHVSPDGLPIGVQLVGRPADELTLLRLSAQLEQARPWRDRHPALW
ncbi:MAG: Amidase [Frankiales bacterium]|nr:Amidase [Frankiales bacterium]